MDVQRERGRSFGAAAESYDRYRPPYPAAALRWAVGSAPSTVVDLGAGTGILTRTLRDLGHDVVAVEPDDAMRARLSAVIGGVTAHAGTAEAMPLDDASAHAVTAGQAYHWFDHDRAHTEIARVLRPGGVFAPLWNIRDTSVPWVAELSRIADRLAGDGGTHAGWHAGDFGPRFGDSERRTFPHAVPMDRAALAEMMRTRSYYLTASPTGRRRFDAALGDLLASLPARFDLPYHTVVYRARRR